MPPRQKKTTPKAAQPATALPPAPRRVTRPARVKYVGPALLAFLLLILDQVQLSAQDGVAEGRGADRDGPRSLPVRPAL